MKPGQLYFAKQVAQLRMAIASDANSSCEYDPVAAPLDVVITFKGPADTKYAESTYTIHFTASTPEWPFKPPSGSWVGQAPAHPFYEFDRDDADRPRRVTNIGNCSGLAGIYGIDNKDPATPWLNGWSPFTTLHDLVTRIQYTLMPEGTEDPFVRKVMKTRNR